jgi:hypothetical protein
MSLDNNFQEKLAVAYAVAVAVAQPIKDTSWLKDAQYIPFIDGLQYAATQTRAIPALAQVSPEDMYFAFSSILSGALKDGDGYVKKLRILADWFDSEQKKRPNWNGEEVQQDLRELADKLEKLL